MRIRDFVELLGQYDPDTELVIDVDGEYVSPKTKKDIVAFKHNYNGVFFKDNAIIITK